MRIAVLGASGKTGQLFITAALKAGHSVRAGVHSTPLPLDHPQLESSPCDVNNAQDVQKLVNGCDAVVSLLGHSRRTPPHTQTHAMQTLVKLLNGKNVPIVSLTGTGVRLAGDKVRLLDYFVAALLKLTYHKRIQDGIDHYQVLANSETPWTIIRVMKLGSGPAQPFTLTPHGPPQYNTNRLTVCQAILIVLGCTAYQKTAPIISD